MRLRLTVIALCFVVAVPVTANALDNQRRGFFFGMGLGPAYTSYDLTYVVEDPGQPPEPRDLARDETWAFGLDFRIGGGVSDRVFLFYLSRIPWFDNPVSRRGSSVTAGINALAATYSFRDTAGGPYLLGGLGLASWSDGFPIGSTKTWWGFGVVAGAGWEFKPHFPLELTVQWGRPTGEEFGFDTSADTVSLIATIGFLLY